MTFIPLQNVLMYNLLLLLSHFKWTDSVEPEPYCTFGLCKDNEFCCDDEQCCNKYTSLYLTVGITVGFCVSVILLGCFYNKCALARCTKGFLTRLCQRKGEQSTLLCTTDI